MMNSSKITFHLAVLCFVVILAVSEFPEWQDQGEDGPKSKVMVEACQNCGKKVHQFQPYRRPYNNRPYNNNYRPYNNNYNQCTCPCRCQERWDPPPEPCYNGRCGVGISAGLGAPSK